MYYNFRWVTCESWFWSCAELECFLDTRSHSKIARKDGTTEVATGPTVCFCVRNRATSDVPDIYTCTVVYEAHHVSHWLCYWSEKVNSFYMHNYSYLVFSWHAILYFLMLPVYDLSNKGWRSISGVITLYQRIYYHFCLMHAVVTQF